MALLAYEEPKKSPMFHLLSFEYRQQVLEQSDTCTCQPTQLSSSGTTNAIVRQYLDQEQDKINRVEFDYSISLLHPDILSQIILSWDYKGFHLRFWYE